MKASIALSTPEPALVARALMPALPWERSDAAACAAYGPLSYHGLLFSKNPMRNFSALLSIILVLAFSVPAAEHKWDPMPYAIANNAVAAAKIDKQLLLFTFMGVGEKKDWKA